MELSDSGRQRVRGVTRAAVGLAAAMLVVGALPVGSAPDVEPSALAVTQVPVDLARDREPGAADAMLAPAWGEGSRIVLIEPGSAPRSLTDRFHSAADPEISFDGRRMLFSGKRNADDLWNVFEVGLDGTGLRQITRDAGNCRSPRYTGRFYTIVAERPWDQIVFSSDLAGERNEYGTLGSTSLYSCRLDGTDLQRLTYNPSSDLEPIVMQDGRLLFSSWQRATLERGERGRIALFAAQTDGLDYALFSGDEGRRIKRMPCLTADRRAIFVESDRGRWDGAGSLAQVHLRRNLHSYRSLTDEQQGLYHSPSPLPGGGLLVSRRPRDGSGTHAVVRFDPESGEQEPLFDDPAWHDVQALRVAPRPRPDGRSSVVSDSFTTGTFYALDIYESDLRGRGWVEPGTAVRLRVLEGLPRPADGSDDSSPLPRRLLGELDVEPDGSFNIEVPAEVPIQLQLVGSDGAPLRSCGWIWVRRRETRGCIGCHENGELSPPNRFVDALRKPSVSLVRATASTPDVRNGKGDSP